MLSVPAPVSKSVLQWLETSKTLFSRLKSFTRLWIYHSKKNKKSSHEGKLSGDSLVLQAGSHIIRVLYHLLFSVLISCFPRRFSLLKARKGYYLEKPVHAFRENVRRWTFDISKPSQQKTWSYQTTHVYHPSMVFGYFSIK